MGRPTKLDDLVAKRICNALAGGNAQATAARAAGVGVSTLKEWLSRGRKGEEPYADFLDQVKRAEAAGEVELVATIRAGATKTWQCAAWLLERRFPRRWARRDPPEKKAPEDLDKLSEEELTARVVELTMEQCERSPEVRDALLARIDRWRQENGS